MDKAKLLEAIAEKKTEHEKYREKLGVDHLYFEFHEGAATTLEWLEKEINSGKFESDSIPLPTIKSEDKVYHAKFRAKGQVKRISESGKRAYVIWVNGAAPSFVDLKSLEVSHD